MLWCYVSYHIQLCIICMLIVYCVKHVICRTVMVIVIVNVIVPVVVIVMSNSTVIVRGCHIFKMPCFIKRQRLPEHIYSYIRYYMYIYIYIYVYTHIMYVVIDSTTYIYIYIYIKQQIHIFKLLN